MVRVMSSPRIIPAAGYPPKQIAEFIGREVSGTTAVSIALMKSPPGWSEPGQTPAFDEYSLVLKGELVISTRKGDITITEGQGAIAYAGEWVRYSSPIGAEYVAVCLPGFSPELVHRDDEHVNEVKEADQLAPDFIYEEVGIEEIGRVEDLWNHLRDHHASRACTFGEQIRSRIFSERRDEILKENCHRHLLVQTARIQPSKKLVAYCISSAAQGEHGEIESIYVEPPYQSHGVGTTFVRRALSWMKEIGAGSITVRVCEGNEEALRFYQKAGFSLRQYCLEIKEDKNDPDGHF